MPWSVVCNGNILGGTIVFVSAQPWRRHVGVLRALSMGRAGNAAAEFALLLPLFAVVLMGIVKFGLVLNNKVELSAGVQAGARIFAISRGSATPWTDGVAAFRSVTANLPAPAPTIAVAVNGAPCNNDATCQAALGAAAGQTVSVTASAPCDLQVVAFNFAPNCVLSSQTTERVE